MLLTLCVNSSCLKNINREKGLVEIQDPFIMVAYKFYDERENTAMTMTEQQAKLFTKLRTLDPSVIEDGLPNETEYLSDTTHIMYVLK